jgi:hypothetical protein
MGQTLLPEQLGIKRSFSNVSSYPKAPFVNDAAASVHHAMKVADALAAHGEMDISQHERLTSCAKEEALFSLRNLVCAKSIKTAFDGKYFAYQMRRAGQFLGDKLGADLRSWYGGVMRIRPAIIISAFLALGIAGAALSASEISGATTHATSFQVHMIASSSNPDIMYKG